MKKRRSMWLCCCALVASCSSARFNLAEYYDHEPTTILVLPAINATTDAEASRLFSSTIYRPLGARGYYLVPPEVVSEILAHEGITAGEELLDVPPANFKKFFGADAVLFVKILKWDTSYMVVSSSVTVSLEYTLVDTASGQVLWRNAGEKEISSSSRQSQGLLGALVNAALTAALVDYVPLARQANEEAFQLFPAGRYHDDYREMKEQAEKERARQSAK